jgi:hypothetical protein
MLSFYSTRSIQYLFINKDSYFDNIKTSEIKDFWTTIEVYKIKKLFDATATKDSENDQLTHLNL